MKYSFNTWAYSDFPNWVPSYPLKDVIERLARIGYDALELGCAQPHAWPYYLDSTKRKEIKRWLTDNNLAVSSVLPAPGGGPGGNVASICKEERDWTVQYMKDCIDLGVELDSKILTCVCGWYAFGTRKRDAWEYAKESLSKVAEHAEKNGVTMVLEPTATDSNLVESADDAITLMEDIGKENVKLMFDTTHVLYRNEVPSDYVYTMGKDLKHVHFADYNRAAPGTSGCDFFPIMQALKDINYTGYVTMENGFTSRSDHADSVARQSLENLKAIEAKLK